MAVTASFLADFTSFHAAVDKSVLKLKGLETGGSRVEKALARVGDSFSGRRIVQDANLAVKAVESIGGASKLTTREQERLNAMVTEAIEKYRVLGQAAPTSLLAMADATKKVETQTTATQKAMAALTGSLGQVAAGFGLATLADRGVRELASFATEAFRVAGALTDASAKTGLTTDTLQQMEFAAKQTGGSLEDFTQASFKLGVALAGGGKSVASALQQVGLSLEDLRRLSPDEQFERVVAALGSVSDATERNRLGTELFGKSFGSIAASVASGYDTIARQATVSGAAQIKALDDAADAWARFTDKGSKSITTLLGSAVLGVEKIASVFESAPDLTAIAAAAGKVAVAMNEAGPAIQSYAEQLKAATVDAQSLTKAQRDELNAALELGVASADDLEKQFFTTTGALRLYQDQQRAAAEATKQQASAMKEAATAAQKYTEGLAALRKLEMSSPGTVPSGIPGLVPDVLGRPEPAGVLESMGGPITAEKARQIGGAYIGELQKTAKQAVSIWQNAIDSMEGYTADGFANMLTGVRSFRDGVMDIWHGLQRSVSELISGIVRQWLAGVGIMGQAAPAIGGGMVGGGLSAAAMGGGGGIGGGGFGFSMGNGAFAKYGTGAIAGGIAGFSAGYGSGSRWAGVGSGALTGALAGMSYGGWYGAAIGAGVGAAAGYFGGSLGKGKNASKVAAARDEWLASFGPYGEYQIADTLGIGQPGHEQATTQFRALKSATTFDQLNLAVLRLQDLMRTAMNPALKMPVGSRNGVPFYKDEAFGLTTPHLAVVGDAREPENVVKDSTLRKIAGSGNAAALDRLADSIDRLIRDQPRAMRIAFTDALVLAGRA